MTKIFHIYLKNKCIYHSLSECEFKKTWEMIHNFISIVEYNFRKEDLTYEELIVSEDVILNSSY